MSKVEKEIWYEPHPVTPERKAELVKQGYKIVDEQFAPHVGAAEKPPAFDVEAAKAYLTDKGVAFAKNIGKAKLEALFEETKAAEAAQ